MIPLLKMTPLLEIVEHAIALPFEDWHAYRCENEVQRLRRLACHFDGCEIQINEIDHSAKPHQHGASMVSLILAHGYTWFLRQSGAGGYLELFAAPGSIVRMAPGDSHYIPTFDGPPSLSLCVFDKVTDWHLHYPPLPRSEARRIHAAAMNNAFLTHKEVDRDAS